MLFGAYSEYISHVINIWKEHLVGYAVLGLKVAQLLFLCIYFNILYLTKFLF